jgi:hypothetical protein
VVKPAFIGVANVHVGTFADALQPLEFLDLRRVVVSGAGLSFGEVLRFGCVGHVGGKT